MPYPANAIANKFIDIAKEKGKSITRMKLCQSACKTYQSLKVADVQGLIETRGATMKYLPPYSPDLNPTEPVFAKLEALSRKAAEQTYDKLWQAMARSWISFILANA